MGNRDVAKQGTHGREEGATGLPRLDYLASVSMYLLEQGVQILVIWSFFYFYAHIRLGNTKYCT